MCSHVGGVAYVAGRAAANILWLKQEEAYVYSV